ncbi:MAG: hypothetical protein OXG44_15370 [Gammaproteobacteria bacterium]|nr:hypothetical protein [Gammaproteobacteria bacterium]
MKSDPLLQPFRLRHLTLKNRMLSTSHTMLYAVDGAPQEREQLYHEEKAKGGIAMTMFGGSSVVAQDSATSSGVHVLCDDAVIPHFRRFAERIHRYDCALMCQITHLGRRARTRAVDWLPTLSASRTRGVDGGFPKVMDRADIDRIVYGAAARRCREGGLDRCEVVGQAHLPEQFWSPAWNSRTDEFGSSLENRLRFGFVVLEEIRRQVGDDFIVGIRITIDQSLDGGLSKADCLEIAQIHERSVSSIFSTSISAVVDRLCRSHAGNVVEGYPLRDTRLATPVHGGITNPTPHRSTLPIGEGGLGLRPPVGVAG